MKATKISSGDIDDLKVASLPTRPTAPTSFGGRGFTAVEMKEAFDRLPLYITEKYNELIDSICESGEESIASDIKTEISDGHTLLKMFADIKDGSFAGYLGVFDTTLGEYLLRLRADIDTLAEAMGITLSE